MLALLIKDQTSKLAFALFVVSAVILLAPNQYLVQYLVALGLDSVASIYRPITAFVLLFCLALLSWENFPVIRKWNNTRRASRNAIRRLRNLTPEEKDILSGYIEGKTRTQTLNSSSAVVCGLLQARIIYAATPNKFALDNYNIHDWAWEYLNKNKHLLK